MSEERHEDYGEREEQRIDRDPTKIDIHAEDIKNVPKSIWSFVKQTLTIKPEVDVPGTIEEINDEIEFKGHNVWILVFSILIASIGLDANSVAVVIGAMLISPLMGPIKGVGLSVGTNNFNLLIKSLKNFGVMIAISLLVSWLYFVISPFKEASSEILARTQPDFRDVLIAFFGGFAGIIATTKKGKAMTVISGVAIATALMPPLCSAGFMLANSHFGPMLNAFYLFTINSILICLAALIVIRYLKFPLVEFVNPKTERKVKIYIGIFMLLVLIPSVYKFYYVMQENSHHRQVKEFIANEVDNYQGARIKDWSVDYMQGDTINVINIEFRENGFITQDKIDEWNMRLTKYGLDPKKNKIYISEGDIKREANTVSYEDLSMIQEKHRKNEEDLRGKLELKEIYIDQLKQQLNAYEKLNASSTRKLEAEIKASFPDVISFNNGLGLGTKMNAKIDTVAFFQVEWDRSLSDSIVEIESARLSRWLKADQGVKHIEIIIKSHGKKEEE